MMEQNHVLTPQRKDNVAECVMKSSKKESQEMVNDVEETETVDVNVTG